MCNVPLLAFKALVIKMHCCASCYGFFRCKGSNRRVLRYILINIDSYFGISQISPDSDLFGLFPKSSLQVQREAEREQYRNIEEPKIDFNYYKSRM